MATVPIVLQTYAKVLHMHLTGGGRSTWLQSKSSQSFIAAEPNQIKIKYSEYPFERFYYSCHCAHRVASLRKSAANAISRGWQVTLVAIQKKPKFYSSITQPN